MTAFVRLLLLACLCLAYACASKEEAKEKTEQAPERDLVQEVSRCSRLYTTTYKVHQVVTRNDVKELKVNLLSHDWQTTLPGDRKAVVPIEVTFQAYIDFGEFTARNVVRTDSLLTLYLPEPHVVVTHSRIDHNGIRQYVSLTRDRFTETEIAALAEQGERKAIADIEQTGILASARQSAAHTLLPLLQRLGYDEGRVRIVFRKESYSPAEWQRMITLTKD